MTPQTMTQAGKRWKASELRKLPPEQPDAILEAAIRAEEDYRNDRDSTAFEAYGKDDLDGERPIPVPVRSDVWVIDCDPSVGA